MSDDAMGFLNTRGACRRDDHRGIAKRRKPLTIGACQSYCRATYTTRRHDRFNDVWRVTACADANKQVALDRQRRHLS